MPYATEGEVLDKMIRDAAADVERVRRDLRLRKLYLADLRARKEQLAENGKPGRIRTAPRLATEQMLDLSNKALPDAIRAVLEAAGKALRAQEIARRVQQGGYETSAKKGLLPNVLGALCRREDLFKRVRRGVYALKSAPTRQRGFLEPPGDTSNEG